MKPIAMEGRTVGAGCPCFLVAEVGINHNGDMELAKKTIEAAAQAGADSVKFQNYRTEDFISDRTLTYEYTSQGQRIVEPQYDMFKRCELTQDALKELKHFCDAQGVLFHSTPTSEQGIQDLVDIGAPVLKNGSDYLTHVDLIRAMGKTGLPTVLSAGMATVAEIDDAVRAFRSTGNQHLILLHCTSAYPTPPADVHLRKIPALQATFGCQVGFSDHTRGSVAALGAVMLGACWIEKHFTLDKSLPGPDHHFSTDPAEFAELVRSVRTLEQNIGDSRIGPVDAELEPRAHSRLSCVAKRLLAAGAIIRSDDLAFRRPGNGFPPNQAHFLLGASSPTGLAGRSHQT